MGVTSASSSPMETGSPACWDPLIASEVQIWTSYTFPFCLVSHKVPLLICYSFKVLPLDLCSSYARIRWCRSNYSCPGWKNVTARQSGAVVLASPNCSRKSHMWPSAALSVHLTTSWVCASQSAKSIRSKSEKNKGVEASGFPGCHGNTQGHTLWFLVSSVFLAACSSQRTWTYRTLR